jgi:hypothetical protein
MRGSFATVEPHRAEQVTAVPVRRSAGLPRFNKHMHPILLQGKHLHEHATRIPTLRTGHFHCSSRGRAQIQNPSPRNYSAAFLSIPSLAIKLLQLKLIHPIQTDKYED